MSVKLVTAWEGPGGSEFLGQLIGVPKRALPMGWVLLFFEMPPLTFHTVGGMLLRQSKCDWAAFSQRGPLPPLPTLEETYILFVGQIQP